MFLFLELFMDEYAMVLRYNSRLSIEDAIIIKGLTSSTTSIWVVGKLTYVIENLT